MKQNQDRFGKMWLNPQYLPTYRIHCARLWILHWVFQWKTARFIYSEKRFELFKYCSKLKSVPGSSQSGFFMQTRKGRWRTWYSEKKAEFQKIEKKGWQKSQTYSKHGRQERRKTHKSAEKDKTVQLTKMHRSQKWIAKMVSCFGWDVQKNYARTKQWPKMSELKNIL